MRAALMGLALVLLTAAIYAPAVRYGFAYEDAPHPNGSWRTLGTALLELRPSRTLVGATWSADPVRLHLGSLALHLLNGVLVGLLAWRLGITPAWLPLGIFLLHPLATEAVVYLSARGDLLATTGVLLAALGATLAPAPAVALVLVGGALALTGKEAGVAVVGLVPLVLARARRPGWAAPAAAVGLLAAVALRGWPAAVAINHSPLWAPIGPWSWIGLQAVAAWRLLGLTIVPIGLSVDHDYARAGVALQGLAAGALVGLAALGLAFWHQAPRVAFGLLWMLLAIAPRFLVRTPTSVLPEHQWYLSLVGAALALGAILRSAPRRAPAPLQECTV